MKRISSKSTFFTKRVFPTIWFGFIGFFLVVNLVSGAWRTAPAFLFIPLILAAFGFFLFKKLVWDLVDEAYDCGDHLLIRNNGEEDLLRLADVVNVSATLMVNPPRITLRMAQSSKFGADISFSPPRALFFNPFKVSPLAEDLIERVDEARRTRYRSE